MENVIGLVLAAAVAGSSGVIGLDRARAFYPTVLIIIASYYVLFAAMGAPRQTLLWEIVIACAFSAAAVLGFRKVFWLIPAALIGHGLFDFVHRFLIHNLGVPQWWPGFCLAFDCFLGAWLTIRMIRRGGLAAGAINYYAGSLGLLGPKTLIFVGVLK
jgi:hypothetical protein